MAKFIKKSFIWLERKDSFINPNKPKIIGIRPKKPIIFTLEGTLIIIIIHVKFLEL